MEFFKYTAKAFLGTLAPALAFVLINKFYLKHGYQLWFAAGMIVGISIAEGIRSQWKLQRLTYAAITGACLGACLLVAQLISISM